MKKTFKAVSFEKSVESFLASMKNIHKQIKWTFYLIKNLFPLSLKAVSGVEVRNGNGSHKSSNNNNNNLCDSDIVDIYEQNQNGSIHLEIGSSSTMVLSAQSNNFYASERFKVLLGKYRLSSVCATDLRFFCSSLLAFLILIFSFFVSTIALIFAHNR